ncbi:glycoside hydrolase family 79 protein [Xylariomycetidae sp. FL0641]|nr:glycoside hydrolase family 79 protein [Xylariomycetidae sp. FL0641]
MNWVISLLALSSPASARDLVKSVGSVASAAINAGQPLEGFLSFSIEFSSFPDFAGNKSAPNLFSNNLLANLGYLTGTKPYIRVGGNTQDYAIYNPNLTIALNGTFNATRSPDYPTTIEIGPSFFESYTTWPSVKYSHGFNMGGNHDDRQWSTLLDTAGIACKTLGKDRLYWWEYGNEADLYAISAQGPVRPSSYNESEFVFEWLSATRAVKGVFEEVCPDIVGNDTYGYLAPSFAGTENQLKAPIAWENGLNTDQNVKLYSSHNYISSANTPGVTLQGTLMNHTRTKESVDAHIAEYNAVIPSHSIPHIFGEANSLSREGRAGLSNTFGAALWNADFLLYCASAGLSRVHMHLGTDYRYASWQPISTSRTTIGTKAPYYGNVAAAALLGNLRIEPTKIAELPLTGGDPEAAYASYVNDDLARILVLNMRAWNHTNADGSLNTAPRPVNAYRFNVGLPAGTTATVRKLVANGSDAITGITWDGISYNYELDQGRPVKLDNVTTGETVSVIDGMVVVQVLDSEAVMLDFASA